MPDLKYRYHQPDRNEKSKQEALLNNKDTSGN